MNFVGGLHYFIYLDFSLLILFLKTDADYHSTCSFKDVMESIRPTNTENNEANGVELEFTLFCEKNVENAVEMLNSALNFVSFFFLALSAFFLNCSAETASSKSKKYMFSFAV